MNIWTTFESLLPKQELVIGTITAVNSSLKTVTLELISGESMIVKGTGNVGSLYLAKDGVITTELPALSTPHDITIY